MVGSSPSASAWLGLAMQIRARGPSLHQRSRRWRKSQGPAFEKIASRRMSRGLMESSGSGWRRPRDEADRQRTPGYGTAEAVGDAERKALAQCLQRVPDEFLLIGAIAL